MRLEITLQFDRETKNKVRYSSEAGNGVSDVYVDKSAFGSEIQAKKNWPDEITITVEG